MCTQVSMLGIITTNAQGDMSFRWAIENQEYAQIVLPPKLYVGIGTSYRVPKTGPIYDNKWFLRNATVMYVAPSKCNFEKNIL